MRVARLHAVSDLRLADEPVPIAEPGTGLVRSPRSGSAAAICTGGPRSASATRSWTSRSCSGMRPRGHRGCGPIGLLLRSLLRAVLLDGDHESGGAVGARDVQHAEAALGE
jgi:hypothetical protein